MGNEPSTPTNSDRDEIINFDPSLDGSKVENDRYSGLRAAFGKLEGTEREMIKSITLTLSEMVIENFHSLLHLFNYLGNPEIEGANISNIADLRQESELLLWLGDLHSSIYELKKKLRSSRMSILDLIHMNEDADYDEKRSLHNTIQLLAEANSQELAEYFEYFGTRGAGDRSSFWNMKYQLGSIIDILDLEK